MRVNDMFSVTFLKKARLFNFLSNLLHACRTERLVKDTYVQFLSQSKSWFVYKQPFI